MPDLAGPQAYAYGYDGAGSLSAIGRCDASGTTQVAAVCLRQDLLGRLVLAGPTSTVVSAGGTACTSDAEVTSAQGRFKYDARNRRVARQAGGQWTYVVSDGAGSPLSELALIGGAWTKVRDYVWLEGRLVAQVEYAGAQAWEYGVHVDHLGTPRALSNRSGQVVWSTYQRPYGEVQERTVVDPLSGRTVGTNVRLPGQYDERLLASVGLQGPYYNWNRWYLPGVGRYLELDPLDSRGAISPRAAIAPLAPSWSTYARANPIRFDDLEGLTTYWCTKPLDAVSGKNMPPQFCTSLATGGWNPANPLAHWYLCVDRDKKKTCGGKAANGTPFGKGTSTAGEDKFNDQCCTPVESSDCIDRCVEDAINDGGNRGFYFLGFTDCQMWVSRTYSRCQQGCKK